jgi:hypothetical protein
MVLQAKYIARNWVAARSFSRTRPQSFWTVLVLIWTALHFMIAAVTAFYWQPLQMIATKNTKNHRDLIASIL